MQRPEVPGYYLKQQDVDLRVSCPARLNSPQRDRHDLRLIIKEHDAKWTQEVVNAITRDKMTPMSPVTRKPVPFYTTSPFEVLPKSVVPQIGLMSPTEVHLQSPLLHLLHSAQGYKDESFSSVLKRAVHDQSNFYTIYNSLGKHSFTRYQ